MNELSLNFCVFTDFICPERAVTIAAGSCAARCSRPTTSSSSSASTRSTEVLPGMAAALPLRREAAATCRVVGLAYLHVEQLLMPPGPWAARRERKRALTV